MQTCYLRVQLPFRVLGVLCAGVVLAMGAENQPLSKTAAASQSNQLPSTVGPKLEVAAPVHDFGSIRQSQTARHEFKIRNAGDEVLQITEVKPSCGCTTAGEWSRTLKPGESGGIPVQLDPARFTGPVSKAITVVSNDRSRPQTFLEIKANIWMAIQISPPVVVFPALTNTDQIVTQTARITSHLESPVELTDLTNSTSMFKAEVRPIIAGKEFELVISTVPPLPVGSSVARIGLRTSSSEMPALSVQAVATVLPAVQVAPTQIILPAAKLVAAEKRYVVVLNHRGATKIAVSDLKVDLPGVDIAVNDSQAARQVTIILTFPAGFETPPSQRIVFKGKTNHPELPSFEVPIVCRAQ